MVSVGQPLYAIYSEELLSYENELLNALQQQSQFSTMKQVMDQVVAAARKNLLLWGLTAQPDCPPGKKPEASAADLLFSVPVFGNAG